MIYRPSLYRLGRLGAVGLAAVYIAGCATGNIKEVKETVSEILQQRLPAIERTADDLGKRVNKLEVKPNAERTIALKTGCRIDGKDVDGLYNVLRGLVLPQYRNSDARADAQANADMFTLGPTGKVGEYRSVPMEDANKDCVPSKGDFVFPDVRDGNPKVGFEVGKKALPEELKFLLLDVTGGKK